MTEISAAMVKELRDATSAGMMDCKRALVETNGDYDAAVKLLREKGMASAAKRADRETTEGVVLTAGRALHGDALGKELEKRLVFSVGGDLAKLRDAVRTRGSLDGSRGTSGGHRGSYGGSPRLGALTCKNVPTSSSVVDRSDHRKPRISPLTCRFRLRWKGFPCYPHD